MTKEDNILYVVVVLPRSKEITEWTIIEFKYLCCPSNIDWIITKTCSLTRTIVSPLNAAFTCLISLVGLNVCRNLMNSHINVKPIYRQNIGFLSEKKNDQIKPPEHQRVRLSAFITFSNFFSPMKYPWQYFKKLQIISVQS